MTLRGLNFITFLLFLFQEFNDKIATKHKIMKFISRVIQIVGRGVKVKGKEGHLQP